MSPLPKLTATKEVREIIENLQLKKAPGHDSINPEMLKQQPRKRIIILTQIITAIHGLVLHNN